METEITNAGGTCRIALVNLQEVIAFQHLVRVDHLEDRQLQGSIDDEQLYEICFPPYRPVTTDEVTIEPNANGNGYIVTTLDPNIKVLPWQSIPGVPEQLGFQLGYPSSSVTMDIQLLAFPLIRVPNYIMVVHYQDRYIMRNGYTRATELLSQGIQTIPCMVIEGQNPALIGLKQGMFDLGTIMSAHPPRLTDFWDDTVTCLFKRPALRYVYDAGVNMIPVSR